MNLRLILVCVLACSSFSFGQLRQGHELFRNDFLSRRTLDASDPKIGRPLNISSVPDTLRVLAILVDFQTDQDNLTSGDGKFQLQTNVTGAIDPPPHDSTYFVYKFRFIENYYRKVSNEKLIVKGDVVGRLVTVSGDMSSYTPRNHNNTTRGLANLAIEAWRKVDSLVTIPFLQYHAFVIFHAGVGHDIDVVGFLGYDPTPNDLPSLYMNLQSFRDALQLPAFPGIQTQSGFTITNTAILPETETRVFVNSGFSDTLKLGVNGLNVATIGSHLGLPDLFDTKTGRPGIGQFGLMDGASIFAYSGLFPPEPSAWEKAYLGWLSPLKIDSTTLNLTLPAVSLISVGDDKVFKIPISSAEYFLVENRSRDPLKNGQRLTIYEKGIIRTQTFARDTTKFSYDDVRAISGSVIDVEDFDWALIGTNDGSGDFDGGGILIWHIDEDVIQAGIASNTVNADPNKKGVDLEEADGSQDIGYVYEFLEPGAATSSGSPLDCWYEGNVSSTYTNVFDSKTFPNSNSNSGAKTLITLKGFSKRDSLMTFDVEIGGETAKPLAGFPKQVQGELNSVAYPVDLDNDGKVEILVSYHQKDQNGIPSGKGALLAWKQNGSAYFAPQDSSGIAAEIDTAVVKSMAFVKHPQSGVVYAAAAAADGLYLWKSADQNSDFRFDRMYKKNFSAETVMFVDTLVVASSFGGGLVTFDLSGNQTATYPSNTVYDLARVGCTDVVAAGVGDTLLLWNSRSGQVVGKNNLSRNASFISTGTVLDNGQTQIVVLSNERIFLFSETGTKIMESGEFTRFLPNSDSFSSGPSLADIDLDGKKEILFVSHFGILLALNTNGYLVDGFPINPQGLPFEQRFGPSVGDVNGDGVVDYLYCDESGRTLNIVDGSSKKKIRLQMGDGMLMPTLFPVANAAGYTLGTAIAGNGGKLIALDFETTYDDSKTPWPMLRFDASQSSSTKISTPNARPISDLLLPRDRVYNWPNPVYGKVTQIRYYTSENADISVKIFDLVGAKVAELSGKSVAGVDNELSWDVSDIQSGIYIARVEAAGPSHADVAFIKIAVVK